MPGRNQISAGHRVTFLERLGEPYLGMYQRLANLSYDEYCSNRTLNEKYILHHILI